MPITLNEHRAGVTNGIIAVASYDTAPQLGLGAFFPSVTSDTLEVTVEVERMKQYIAVDVQRGRRSNRNTFTKSTEHIYIPPFHSEKFDFTSLQGYDRGFNTGDGPSMSGARAMISNGAKKVIALQNKIKRAIEKQRADVLQTGVVTLVNGDSINYNRQASSMVQLSGGALWSATTTSDPGGVLVTGANFIIEQGLSAGVKFNVVMGAAAFNNFMLSDKIKAEAAFLNKIDRISIGMPQFDNTTGFVLQGQYGHGNFIFYIWTYNGWYQNASDQIVRYIATDNIVMLPDDFEGKTAFGALPQVMGDVVTGQYIQPVEGDFFFYDLIDQEKKTWDAVVEAAPLAVPVSIDRIYTATVN